ncbi:PQ loop repeat protein [Talaromyces stipitatus ATCC 10500]|uniref:PQ loop repeat protein n=1 Tax=Talaromyces stipitatus (strain ATCC 10500 / CBS 375.48 / QM 6759 / NRRL 1006) TaxID=441959 RepID=B8MKP1_TALSN|nr:PQ loop repeat protein [Talaromyces stipitatus ATCC 10500]EED14890.1 PQ loop repeat protein [Talaromyces stipitatus ATCC 10500]
MSSPVLSPLHSLTGYSLPQHCEPSSNFLALLSSTLHICIPNELGLISSSLGCLSIVSWLFAQLPQIYKNYKLQSTAGLSAFFLVEWCLGDTANLVGALFTRQATWQVTIASYYVFVDVVLVIQYYWYTYVKKKGKGKDSVDGSFDEDNAPIYDGIRVRDENQPVDDVYSTKIMRPSEPKDVELFKSSANSPPRFYSPSYSEKFGNRRVRNTGYPSGTNASPTPSMATSPTHSPLPSNFDAITDSHDMDIETIGRILSWMSTILYLGSRLPQLYKNYVRKSTSGLSPLLFMAAFCGNFFYSASLLTNPNAWYDYPAYGGGGWADKDGNNRAEWVALATPFFLGAAGVLSLDAFMGVQFLIYGDQGGEPLVTVDDPTDPGHKRWRRVSGWMRGWIPSGELNKYLRSNSGSQLAETRSLLGDSNTSGHNYGGV